MDHLSFKKSQQLFEQVTHTPLSGPELDNAFYVFALRVTSEDSIGKRKLSANKYYYLLDGFTVYDDRILVSKDRYKKTIYDYYENENHFSAPHISISAIVGENGAGKSSLLEFELRLINNFSAVIFGEYAKVDGWPHLHFIDGVDGELYYVLNQKAYCLSVKGRNVKLYCYYWQEAEEDGKIVFKPSNSGSSDIIHGDPVSNIDMPIRSVYYTSYFESLKKLLPRFFYTVVLNQSVYAYNTKDFKAECNSEQYEIAVRRREKTNEKGEKIPYSTEDKCWLNGLFHKNDGYQIPLVLTPYRFEGNYDINVENQLAYERLISIMVRTEEPGRNINGHLKVTTFDLKLKDNSYDINCLHQKIGYNQFTAEDFEKMKQLLLSYWSELIQYDINGNSQSRLYRTQAINYLVYKTLKIANTYDGYGYFRDKYNVKAQPFSEKDFNFLVASTMADNSHVTNKLFRTIAYLIWDIYEIHVGNKEMPVSLMVKDINERWMSILNEKRLDLMNSVASTLVLEAAVPPPFFETTIKLEELNTGVFVPFEYLSSGEKQQAFTTSSLVYHLKNLDSVSKDRSTDKRSTYENVQIILEEVELYFHPELQRQFVRNLLEGILQAGLNNIKWINICIVTHSPFVLSDIPKCNVLALKKKDDTTEKISSFAANIHEMLKLSFFLDKGSVGDFASWTTTRIAKCLRIVRWINKIEPAPDFFPSLDNIPEEYKFLEEFRTITNNMKFSVDGFNYVYSPEVLLSQINMIEEPIVRRVLLDDFRRTFLDKEVEYRESMRNLLQSQLDALDN